MSYLDGGLALPSQDFDMGDAVANEFDSHPAEDLMDEDEDDVPPPVLKLNQSMVNGA